jgi:hypothetical protein
VLRKGAEAAVRRSVVKRASLASFRRRVVRHQIVYLYRAMPKMTMPRTDMIRARPPHTHRWRCFLNQLRMYILGVRSFGSLLMVDLWRRAGYVVVSGCEFEHLNRRLAATPRESDTWLPAESCS